jgi:c(7)-type cytochrome triheme protein
VSGPPGRGRPGPARPVRALATLGLVLALLPGCSVESRQRWLPYFFDGVPEAGRQEPPPTRKIRQDLQREVEGLRRENADLRAAAQARAEGARAADGERPAEQARTWEEAAALLPRDAVGAVDWNLAVETGVIRPRPGLDPAAPTQSVFDLDVKLAHGGQPFFAASFRHLPHTRWLACGSCHPAPFPLTAGSPRPVVTMAAIRDGRTCGLCHGRVTFGVETRCAACHQGIPTTDTWRPPAPASPLEGLRSWSEVQARLPVKVGTPDWVGALADGLFAPKSRPEQTALFTLDLNVERVPKEGGDAMKVVFPHKAHTALLACDSCHPAPFQFQAGATPITMAQLEKGELCGTCHGKVAFPVTACGRCHPALGG